MRSTCKTLAEMREHPGGGAGPSDAESEELRAKDRAKICAGRKITRAEGWQKMEGEKWEAKRRELMVVG